jgi:small GTP-binding protein
MDYQQSIFTLLSYHKQLQYFSQQLNLDSLVELMNNNLKHLESNCLSIAVVGDFNRGKTTFINALLGEEILPYDILPTTATVNRITYGLVSRVKVCFKDGREQVIAIHQLADYVTKQTAESEAVAATVKEAIVYYPLPYFQNNNVEIIDTPGLSDDTDMTSVTLSILRQCEIAIMMISAHSPFSINEQNFLTQKLLAKGIRRVLFVVNGIDRFNRPEDAERVVKFIKNRIQESIQEWAEQQSSSEPYLSHFVKPKVWGISAFQALEGKQTKNMALLAKSRFVNFEYDLKTFLNQERGVILLEVAVHHIITAGTEIIKTLIDQELKLERDQANLRKIADVIASELDTIRHGKRDIISSTDSHITSSQHQAKTLEYRLENALKQVASHVIESTTVTISDLSDAPNAFQSNLASMIGDALQNTSKSLAQEFQREIELKLNLAENQLSEFLEGLFQMITKITLQLQQLDIELSIENNPLIFAQSIQQIHQTFKPPYLSTLSFSLPSNSELFVFEDNPSGAGTTWGAVIGFLVTGGNPGGAAIGAAIGAGVGNNMRAKKFKENYQPKVIAEIEKQLKIMNVTETVDHYISEAFYPRVQLYSLVIQEVNSLLEIIQTTLSQYLGQQEAIAWDKRQRLNHIRAETQKILDDAQKIFWELSQMGSA